MHPLYVPGSLTYLKQSTIAARADAWPLVINIEPTDACNLSCSYCPTKTRTPLFMQMEMFRSVVDQLPTRRIMLNLHKDGEPTLAPNFCQMVSYAQGSEKFEMVHFNTNGTVHRDVQGCDITISIDAARRSTYFLTKGRDLLDLVEKNADLYRRKNHVRVKCIESVGPEEVEMFRNRWKGWEVQTHPQHQWTAGPDTQADRKPCRILQYALAINADGSCSVCNFDWDHRGLVGSYQDIRGAFEISRLMFGLQRQGVYSPACCSNCQNWRCEHD